VYNPFGRMVPTRVAFTPMVGLSINYLFQAPIRGFRCCPIVCVVSLPTAMVVLVVTSKGPSDAGCQVAPFEFLPDVLELEQLPSPSSFQLSGPASSDNCGVKHTTHASLDKRREEPTAELLRMHYKFGHINFSRLRAMARNGALPKPLADCPLPLCPSCLYGKARRRSTPKQNQEVD
jgi:hypothetical protein